MRCSRHETRRRRDGPKKNTLPGIKLGTDGAVLLAQKNGNFVSSQPFPPYRANLTHSPRVNFCALTDIPKSVFVDLAERPWRPVGEWP